MIISDLNYLEAAEANVEGGYYFGNNVHVRVEKNLKVNNDFNSRVNVRGNFAGAEAEAFAFGKNTSAEGFTFTETVQGHSSVALASSLSASDKDRFFFKRW